MSFTAESDDESEDDSLLVFLVDSCNAPNERARRVERQEVSKEVEVCGLGVMIDV